MIKITVETRAKEDIILGLFEGNEDKISELDEFEF